MFVIDSTGKFRNQTKQKQKILTMRAHLQGVTGFISLRREKQKVLGWMLSGNEVSIHTLTHTHTPALVMNSSNSVADSF